MPECPPISRLAHSPNVKKTPSRRSIVALDDLRLLVIEGDERKNFLQGQLTQDIALASPTATILAGWADAKGRLQFAGALFSRPLDEGEGLGLLVPADRAQALLQRLQMYVLRARVQLRLGDDRVVGVLSNPAADSPPGTELMEGALAGALKISGTGDRYFLLGAKADRALRDTPSQPPNSWQLADIRAGLPSITAATAGEFLPQMVNLDLLGGISFTKGCYTGQEIVARTKYLGRVKRRMLRFSGTGAPPAAGAALYGTRGVSGQVVSAALTENGGEFLAVLVLDDLPGPFYLDEGHTREVTSLELPYPIPL